MHQKRTYRNLAQKENLVSFRVAVKETDLFVHATKSLEKITRDFILRYRGYVEAYIEKHQDFAKTFNSWHINGPAPVIVKNMAKAGEKAGVGPMAAVAGAIAEHVGRDLLSYSDEVIVENGGDVFIKAGSPVTVAIYAGNSPLSMQIGLRVDSVKKALCVCTSSGTVGHSFSFGKADAVCVLSESCSLADAVATSICNQVKLKTDIQKAINFGKSIKGVAGLIVIMGNEIGLWGELDIVSIQGKKS
ncbi:MAG: UPF0280 family protein [Deltaproteobacteria bacterium]|nr:UPF0280 family protein [Deltaproteobacteria bacterium]MBW2662016.1 UPF0280 family protein [Deltaproteobacteria bacterium]